MTQLPPALLPRPGGRGLATGDRASLSARIARAWELFVALAEPLDLDAPTRAKGLVVRDVLVPLGAWDDNRPLEQLVDEARRGVVGDHDQGALVDSVRAAHRDAATADVIAALRRQGEQMSQWAASPAADQDGLLPVASMLGTIPLLTFLHASTYPLSTSALDLEHAGAEVPDELLRLGLVGVLDTMGALAARQGLMASLVVVAPDIVAGFGAMPRDWTTAELTERVDLEHPAALGPRIDGTARALLDVTAGRADAVRAMASQHLVFHDLPGLLALAPLVEQVPGIPGRAAIHASIRAVHAVSSLVGMLPFGRRRERGA